MIKLNDSLSEFSYGYGVTREFERLLNEVGLSTTPFFPNLIQEGERGFDVGMETRRGCIVLIQFKLGDELKRFRKNNSQQKAPKLQRPFWRFKINPPKNQFKLLSDAEKQGAIVCYVAPRFSKWEDYVRRYRRNQILDGSIFVFPSDIEKCRLAQGKSKSNQVVYDQTSSYVYSEPMELSEVKKEDIRQKIEECVKYSDLLLIEKIETLYDYFRPIVDTPPFYGLLDLNPSSPVGKAKIIGHITLNLGANLVYVTESNREIAHWLLHGRFD